MTRFSKLLAVGSALAMAAVATSADAAVFISGGGSWSNNTSTTPRSKSLTSFEFSFEIPDLLTVSGDTASTSAFSDFSYFLNGVAVAGTPLEIRFYPSAYNGLFDLVFSDEVLSFYGADVGSDGSVESGSYSFTSALNARSPSGVGGLTISSISSAPVPDAATWAMMIVGVGAIGGAMRARRQIKAAISFA